MFTDDLFVIEIHFVSLNVELSTNNVVLDLKHHHKGSSVRKVRFASDQLMISAAKTLKFLDLNSGQVIRKIDNCGQKVYSLLVIDNYLVCCGDDSGSFKVWDYRVDRGVHMEASECDQYISDLDIDSHRRTVLAASGDGTLSAFNIRAKRMQHQSELFDAGFQSVRYMEAKGKVVVGAEDGAINIFNVNEWGNISDRFPIRGNTTRSQGFCSIDNMELITDEVLVVGSSDGGLRAVNIFPNKVIEVISSCESGVECLDVNQISQSIVASNDNVIKLYKYKQIDSKLTKKTKNSDFFAALS